MFDLGAFSPRACTQLCAQDDPRRTQDCQKTAQHDAQDAPGTAVSDVLRMASARRLAGREHWFLTPWELERLAPQTENVLLDKGLAVSSISCALKAA